MNWSQEINDYHRQNGMTKKGLQSEWLNNVLLISTLSILFFFYKMLIFF